MIFNEDDCEQKIKFLVTIILIVRSVAFNKSYIC